MNIQKRNEYEEKMNLKFCTYVILYSSKTNDCDRQVDEAFCTYVILYSSKTST